MSSFGDVMILTSVSCSSMVLSSLLMAFLPLNPKLLSITAHFSAGIVSFAVAGELLVLALKHFSKSVLDYALIISGFSLAVVGLILLTYLMESIEKRQVSNPNTNDGNVERKSFRDSLLRLPWTQLLLLSVGTFLDGFLLGISATDDSSAGLVVAIAWAFETGTFAGMATVSLRQKNFSRLVCSLITLILVAFLYIGAILAVTVFRDTGREVFMAIMSFGVGAFLFVVMESLLLEARRDPSGVNWLTKSVLYFGFLIGLILHLVT